MALAATHKASSSATSGTPLTLIATRVVRSVDLRVGSALFAGGAEQERERPRLVSEDERARRQRRHPALELLALDREAQPEPALDLRGVEGLHRDPDLDDRDRQRVLDPVSAAKAPVAHAVERDLLDRRRRLVGIEGDVAEEDAVGPGDRALAQDDRLLAPEAVAELPQPFLQGLGAARRAGGDGGGEQAAGRGTPRRAPGRPSRARALPRLWAASPSAPHLTEPSRPAASSPRSALDVGRQLGFVELAHGGLLDDPPGIGVDERRAAADPVEVRQGAVAVEPERVGPSAVGDQLTDRLAVVARVDAEEVDAGRE